MLLHSWVRARHFLRPLACAIPLCSSTRRRRRAMAEARGVHTQKVAIITGSTEGGGSIVLTSTVSGYVPEKLIGPYCVSKTALFSLTKALAPALTPMNIRVNCIALGFIRTKFCAVLWKNKVLKDELMKKNNLVRMGEPKECSGVVSFLCSPDASYITSETIVVSGGAISHL